MVDLLTDDTQPGKALASELDEISSVRNNGGSGVGFEDLDMQDMTINHVTVQLITNMFPDLNNIGKIRAEKMQLDESNGEGVWGKKDNMFCVLYKALN